MPKKAKKMKARFVRHAWERDERAFRYKRTCRACGLLERVRVGKKGGAQIYYLRDGVEVDAGPCPGSRIS